MGSPLLPLVASLHSPPPHSLPWFRLGDVGLAGVPDPAGFFVLARRPGCRALVDATVRQTRHTPMADAHRPRRTDCPDRGVAHRPVTIADRAQAHAAIALVDNVPMTPVPAVHLGIGLLGLVSSAAVLAAGLNESFGGRSSRDAGTFQIED